MTTPDRYSDRSDANRVPAAPGPTPGLTEAPTPGYGSDTGYVPSRDLGSDRPPGTDQDQRHADQGQHHAGQDQRHADQGQHQTGQERHRTGHGDGDSAGSGPLVPHETQSELGVRLQHALNNFVDTPQQAVADAESVLDEVATRISHAIEERRTALRTAAKGEDTEQLRLALLSYRDFAERLLKV